ncbi:MAG: polysaccharide deacetylase family protein [Cyclobacteriaceae bacterium]|jgi:peptidoglycan/xylan/chitin deacetylase (PgdA/CDA1 family)|nr:polysaccharide deacetylase family protein [Cyclobacteriaceae bacterium]MDH4294973.1 polysaccharide deacetylase family protein [Cyclobacteriaceae bacterium]
MRLNYWFEIIFFISSSAIPSSEVKARALADSDKEVVCFVYHRVGDSRYPSTNISQKDFEAHLAYLVKNNFQVLSLADALKYIKSDEPARKTVVITVDDGYKSFYMNGLPLLRKYGLPATLFINTETVGGGDYMNWSELMTATQSGIEIGNHTHTHKYFLNEPDDSRYTSFKQEIVLSQSLISEHLKVLPKVFSYPYGEFDVEMENIVRQTGFVGAAAQNSGVIYSGTNLYRCPRFPMSEAYAALDKFAEKTSMKALRVISSSPDNLIGIQDLRPVLTLTIDYTDLRLSAIQCFVQGNECEYQIPGKTDKTATITLQSTKSIAGRRRTLYTVTVPDKAGNWHWYSRLWINEKVP